MSIFWSWEHGKIGETCHAFKGGTLGTLSLCGEAPATEPMMRPPWYEMRCQACEKLRSNEPEVFPNYYFGKVVLDLEARLACQRELPTRIASPGCQPSWAVRPANLEGQAGLPTCPCGNAGLARLSGSDRTSRAYPLMKQFPA